MEKYCPPYLHKLYVIPPEVYNKFIPQNSRMLTEGLYQSSYKTCVKFHFIYLFILFIFFFRGGGGIFGLFPTLDVSVSLEFLNV